MTLIFMTALVGLPMLMIMLCLAPLVPEEDLFLWAALAWAACGVLAKVIYIAKGENCVDLPRMTLGGGMALLMAIPLLFKRKVKE